MPVNTFLAIIAFYAVLDIYTYLGLRSLWKDKLTKILFTLLYIGVSCWIYYAFYVLLDTVKADVYFRNVAYAPYLGIGLTALITKLLFSVLMLVQDIWRVGKGMIKYTKDANQTFAPVEITKHIPARR